jgi:arsenate reductase-like glutaredoxin family protein
LARRTGDAGASLTTWPTQEQRERLAISAPGAAQVQIFGRKDSRETQRALRFFKERRIPVSFVDLAVKVLASTELRRFTSRFDARSALDDTSRAYRESGLGYMRLGDDEIFERLLSNQGLLKLPLVRVGQNVTIGVDERAWKGWLAG